MHSICAPCFCPENSSKKFHHQFSNVSKRKNQSIPSSSTSISEKLREYFGYHYIPAMFSAFQHYSVHSIVNGCSSSNLYDNETMMLSIYSSILNKTKFMMIDLKFNRHICTLDYEYNGLINVREFHSAWSTDRTRIIVLVPLGHGSTLLDFYRGKFSRSTLKLNDRSIFIFKSLNKMQNSIEEFIQSILRLDFNSIRILGHHS